MNKGLRLLGAAGAGAGLMYLFDPDRGKRRRAWVGNKTTHVVKVAGDVTGKTGRDVRNHLQGAMAQIGSLFQSNDVSDDVLQARVRTKLGRIVSHPSAIEVKADNGLVLLAGPILAKEEHYLLEGVSRVRGVKTIQNLLEAHEEAGDIPALQGGRERQPERFGVMKENWSPTTRLVATAVGGALALYGAKRLGVLGSALGSLGLGVITRAITNIETGALVGLDSERKAIEIQKTINIDSPVERVFDYWSHPENFPEFMSHVREVRRTGDGLYHWTVGGPGGMLVEWDAGITDLEFYKLLAWNSLPGAIIEQKGVTRFSSDPDGGTRIDVKMSYNPPAGALGHAIAALFGVDPKHEMDDDLMRMKSFLETGIKPHDAAEKLDAPVQ